MEVAIVTAEELLRQIEELKQEIQGLREALAILSDKVAQGRKN